jgi:DNA repair exonuclease SbcCD ATPase subunit
VNIGADEKSVNNILVRYCNLNAFTVKSNLCTGTEINRNYIRSTCNGGNAAVEVTNNVINQLWYVSGGIVRNNVPVNNAKVEKPAMDNKELEDLKSKCKNLEAQLKDKEEELQGAYDDYDTMEKMRDNEKERADNLEKQLSEVNSNDNELEELRKQLSDKEAEISNLANKINELEGRVIPEDKTAELEDTTNKLKDANNTIANLTSENADLKTQIEQYKTTITNNTVFLKETKDACDAEKQVVVDERNKLVVERDNLKEDNDSLFALIEQKDKLILELEQKVQDADNKSNSSISIPIESEELLTEEGREEYTDAVRSAEGVNIMAGELTTINALNLANGKELLDKDRYVVALVTEEGDYLCDQDGDALCIYIIDNIQVPEILKNDKKFYETENKVKLVKMSSGN